QSLKQIRSWIRHLPRNERRPIYLRYFGNDRESISYYLKAALAAKRLTVLGDRGRLPNRGLLIISPIRVAGVYDGQDRYAALRGQQPVAVIGHSMLVYDLDKIRKRHKGFVWTPPKPGLPAGRIYGE